MPERHWYRSSVRLVADSRPSRNAGVNMDAASNPGTKRAGMEIKKIYRHAPGVRVSHWINVVVITIMLMSGLQIFNAHPKLYWGNWSDDGKAWLAMEGKATDAGRESEQLMIILAHL